MDPFAEIAVFTQVVDLCGFTRAAANLRLTPSGVSPVRDKCACRHSDSDALSSIAAEVSRRGAVVRGGTWPEGAVAEL
jgi:hypothetical protein